MLLKCLFLYGGAEEAFDIILIANAKPQRRPAELNKCIFGYLCWGCIKLGSFAGISNAIFLAQLVDVVHSFSQIMKQQTRNVLHHR